MGPLNSENCSSSTSSDDILMTEPSHDPLQLIQTSDSSAHFNVSPDPNTFCSQLPSFTAPNLLPFQSNPHSHQKVENVLNQFNLKQTKFEQKKFFKAEKKKIHYEEKQYKKVEKKLKSLQKDKDKVDKKYWKTKDLDMRDPNIHCDINSYTSNPVPPYQLDHLQFYPSQPVLSSAQAKAHPYLNPNTRIEPNFVQPYNPPSFQSPGFIPRLNKSCPANTSSPNRYLIIPPQPATLDRSYPVSSNPTRLYPETDPTNRFDNVEVPKPSMVIDPVARHLQLKAVCNIQMYQAKKQAKAARKVEKERERLGKKATKKLTKGQN